MSVRSFLWPHPNIYCYEVKMLYSLVWTGFFASKPILCFRNFPHVIVMSYIYFLLALYSFWSFSFFFIYFYCSVLVGQFCYLSSILPWLFTSQFTHPVRFHYILNASSRLSNYVEFCITTLKSWELYNIACNTSMLTLTKSGWETIIVEKYLFL